jgi:hypothetical protein
MITVIDPNNKVLYINNSNSSNIIKYDTNVHETNNMVRQELINPYVRLLLRRRSDTVITTNYQGKEIDTDFVNSNLINENKQTTIRSNTENEEYVIDLIGYDQNDVNDLHFSNKYLEYSRFDVPNAKRMEGIGIRTIEIVQDNTFITQATIQLSIIYPEQNLTSDNPYNILFASSPTPEIELMVKGIYGYAVTYKFMLNGVPKINFNPENMTMDVILTMVSQQWSPLLSVSMWHLYALPFMQTSSKLKTKLNLRSTEPPTSLYEFIKRGKALYNDLQPLRQNPQLQQRQKDLLDKLDIIKKVINFSQNFNVTYYVFYPSRKVDVIFNKNFSKTTKRYNVTRPSSIDVNRQFTDTYNRFMSSLGQNAYLKETGLLVYSDNVRYIGYEGSNAELDFSEMFKRLENIAADLEREDADIKKNKKEEVNNVIGNVFGKSSQGNIFLPTVENVLKLFCDDIDSFFKLIRDVTIKAEGKLNERTKLVDTGFGGIDGVHAFPIYAEYDVNSNGVGSLNKKMPKYEDFDEVKLIKDFYNSSIFMNFYNSELKNEGVTSTNELYVNQTAINRDKASIDNISSVEVLLDNYYYSIKYIVDKYVKGYKTGDLTGYPYSDNLTLFERFKFVDRAFNKIDGNILLDFSFLTDNDLDDKDVYSIIQELLKRNNFAIYPMESFNVFDKDKIQGIFEPQEIGRGQQEPLFLVQLRNDKLTQTDSNLTHISDSIKDANTFPSDFKTDVSDNNIDSNAICFRVGYKESNQSYFTGFSVKGVENVKTEEYLKIQQDIIRKAGKSTSLILGQSYYDYYTSMSYTATINTLLNVNIQPTQFFDLANIPIHYGVYRIRRVVHKISEDSMLTEFTGDKISKYITPFSTTFSQAIDMYYDSLSNLLNTNEENNVGVSNQKTFDNFVRLNNINTNVQENDTSLIIDLGYRQIIIDKNYSDNYDFSFKPEYIFRNNNV